MDVLLEILKYTVPALIVFFTVWVMMRTWAKNEDQRRKAEFNMHISDEILPVRLQAYERSILLLERISPESMVLRLSRNDFTTRQLLQELLTAITTEFDHNIAQQTYMSSEAWEKMKKSIDTVMEGITLEDMVNDHYKKMQIEIKIKR